MFIQVTEIISRYFFMKYDKQVGLPLIVGIFYWKRETNVYTTTQENSGNKKKEERKGDLELQISM